MIDHMGVLVRDFDSEASFYEAALSALGYRRGMAKPGVLQLVCDTDSVWIEQAGPDVSPVPCHIAFTARDADGVKAFYRAAMSKGGSDNGEPGPRPQYGPGYYAAFVHDPEGNNIEAVLHDYRA